VLPHPGAPHGLQRASRVFEPYPVEVSAARRFVAGTLERWHIRADEVALLVSELATNAVLHARSDFEVSVCRLPSGVRVEVFDRNTRLPTPAIVPADAYSGRGLLLVQTLASAWGVESRSDEGKIIWFEVHEHQQVAV
jgi:anti-sigma regulatory factor (Ser/Thr protein kinase)